MPDLKGLLELGAGDPHDLPHVEPIWQRARVHVRRRRGIGAVALVVTVAASIGVYRLLPLDGRSGTPANRGNLPGTVLRPGQLEAGTYVAGEFDLPFSFRTRGDSWSASVVEPTWVALIRRSHYLHVQRWDAVFDPAGDGTEVLPLPVDIARWLVHHPRLRAESPVRVQIGGLSGFAIEVSVAQPLAISPDECDGQGCVLLGRVGGTGEPVDIGRGERARFIVLGAPGDQVVIHYRAGEADFERVASRAEWLLSTFTFSGSA
jgi:hypothetical protein